MRGFGSRDDVVVVVGCVVEVDGAGRGRIV